MIKNHRFNSFVSIVCGVPQCYQDGTTHTNRFHSQTTRVASVNTRNLAESLVVKRAFRVNKQWTTGKKKW